MFSKTNILKMYLSFLNDFLSVERFAEYHDITVGAAKSIIARGKVINYEQNPSMRGYFTNNQGTILDEKFSPNNSKFFRQRYEALLLSEHSA